MEIQAELLEKELWEKFEQCPNEMVVTRQGRMMFPVLKIKVSGLVPNAYYRLQLQFIHVDNARYRFSNGKWSQIQTESDNSGSNIYVHPDSPNIGSFWMNEKGVDFSKVRLTHKTVLNNNNVLLSSMRKYVPIVQIVKLNYLAEPELVTSFRIPKAEFITVTAYQNEKLSQLKIRYNSHAKAFLDRTKTRTKETTPAPVAKSFAVSQTETYNESYYNPKIMESCYPSAIRYPGLFPQSFQSNHPETEGQINRNLNMGIALDFQQNIYSNMDPSIYNTYADPRSQWLDSVPQGNCYYTNTPFAAMHR